MAHSSLHLAGRDDAPESARNGKDAGYLTLAPWLALARDLSTLCVPVQPRPQFRIELEQRLLVAARRQQARATLAIPLPSAESAPGLRDRMTERLLPPLGDTSRWWMVGAAAVGSAVSIAGLVSYFWRHRGQQAA